MKRVLSVLSCLFVIFLFAGCGQQNLRTSNPPPSAGQKNEFPDFLVGVWQADKNNWAFKFERDGTILRLVHMLAGPVKMEEGGIYEDGPDPNTFAYFAMGPCEAKYNPTNRHLRVKIFLDAFLMRLPHGDLKGRMEDYFDGPVSEDGRTWTVSWRNYCWLEGADPPPIDDINANPEKLIFARTDVNDIE